MSNNPLKRLALQTLGIEVAGTEQLQIEAHPENEAYLSTKRLRLGHWLD